MKLKPIISNQTLTTHSDTFVQQINLLYRLGVKGLSDDELDAFGYTRNDVINPDMMRVYEFFGDSVQTNVVEAARSDDGFVVQSINETLTDFIDQILAVEEF